MWCPSYWPCENCRCLGGKDEGNCMEALIQINVVFYNHELIGPSESVCWLCRSAENGQGLEKNSGAWNLPGDGARRTSFAMP